MNRFKHCKNGMTYIEVVAAIAILAIFGTSIFFMLAYLFDRIILSQKKLIAAMRINTQMADYKINALKNQLTNNSTLNNSEPASKSEKEFNSPDMKVSLKKVSDFKDSPLNKYKNLHLIKATAKDEINVYGQSYSFIYIPEKSEK